MTLLGQRTLLVNPPRINGIAFTRQGRCQEREEVLGTTKPPYTLAVLGALFRREGLDVRLVDMTAEGIDVAALVRRLDAEGFAPTLIVFPSTTPTLDADVREMAKLKRRYDAPLFCFGPHASTAPKESMARAADVDGMIVGEPEESVLMLARRTSLDDLGSIPGMTWRAGADVHPHQSRANVFRFSGDAVSGVGSRAGGFLFAAARRQAVRARRDQPRLSVLVRLLRRADPPGPQVPRAAGQGHRRRDGEGLPRARHRVLLSLGRHRHAQRQDVRRLLRRADRAQAPGAVVRQRPRRQPHRSRIRQEAQGRRLLDARARHRDRVR